MKTVDREVLLNWWLEKYHNTTVQEIIQKYDKETLSSADWFKMFPVTKEQEQEWIDWAKNYIRKETKMSKYMLERQWPYVYLDCSPYVNRDNEDDEIISNLIKGSKKLMEDKEYNEYVKKSGFLNFDEK